MEVLKARDLGMPLDYAEKDRFSVKESLAPRFWIFHIVVAACVVLNATALGLIIYDHIDSVEINWTALVFQCLAAILSFAVLGMQIGFFLMRSKNVQRELSAADLEMLAVDEASEYETMDQNTSGALEEMRRIMPTVYNNHYRAASERMARVNTTSDELVRDTLGSSVLDLK